MDREERYSRQESIINNERLSTMKVTVVGTGAIGRNCAIQLAAMGVQHLQLVDFDTIEESNIASQGWLEDDLGKNKVDALADYCKRINSEIKVKAVSSRFGRNMDTGEVVFCCVDKMRARSLIADTAKQKADLFIDGRMAAETLQVYTACDEESHATYKNTLFSDGEAYQGACTAKSTIYCANVAAGVMTAQLTKYLRDFPLDNCVEFNLFCNEFEVK
jgi:sulfur carrier protein ThiS adenylyltransferase